MGRLKERRHPACAAKRELELRKPDGRAAHWTDRRLRGFTARGVGDRTKRHPPAAVRALQPRNEPKITEQHLRRITGRSASDLWVVGDYGTMLQFNGMTWSNVPTPGREHLNGIALHPGSRQGWAVGEKGRVLPLDYTKVGIMAFDTTQTLQGVWVSRDGQRLLASGTGDKGGPI